MGDAIREQVQILTLFVYEEEGEVFEEKIEMAVGELVFAGEVVRVGECG